MMMKKIAVLGSTGSIGRNVVEILKAFPDRYRAFALAAGGNVDLLARQMAFLHPEVVVVRTEAHVRELQKLVPAGGCEILWGDEGYAAAATHPEVDTVVSAIVGARSEERRVGKEC